MNLLRNQLAATIGGLFWDQAGDTGGGGGGGGAVQVAPADARAFLADLGHNADSLKTMPDADVVKLHGTVSANFTKRAQAESEAALARAREAAKDLKLELPKDALLSQQDVERIAAHARERGLTKEQAQKQLENENAFAKSVAERARATADTQRDALSKGWKEAVQKDPDLGGDKWVKTDAHMKLAMDNFMPEDVKDMKELREILTTSGLANHPGMVRMLNAIGAALSEDDPGTGGGAAAASGGAAKNAVKTLYGETTPE